MTFDDITEDGRLWSVRYDGESDNALYTLKVRSFLLNENIIDDDSFVEYMNTI